jgi:triosephosphate isomerase (TIM)
MNVAPAMNSTRTRLDREILIAISLKMYLDPDETVSWSMAVADLARAHPATAGGDVKLIVLPSFPSVASVVQAFAGTQVRVGAQDLFWEDRGPYTGAVSGADLHQIGCRYVEVGHVERRKIFGEDNQIANKKLIAALRNNLTPVLCVGEDEQVASQRAAAQCVEQLEAMLHGFKQLDISQRPIIAYEPSWAIGMAQPASIEHIVTVVRTLKSWIDRDPQLSGSPLIYGGSAGEGLLSELIGSTDGLFLGRFAHDPTMLKSILDETLQLL